MKEWRKDDKYARALTTGGRALVGLHTHEGQWVAFIAGALITAVLISVLFDPALIFLSALDRLKA